MESSSNSHKDRAMAAVETITASPIPVSPALLPFPKRQTASGEKPLIQSKGTASVPKKVTFDPKKHIAYTPPSKVYTMAELGYKESRGVSPIGVSEPFGLFSPEAIQQMRAEVLSDEVWDKYQYSSNLAQCQLRGYAAE